jgi:uncharacterized protein YfaT (DUF1175 family)
VSDQGMPRMSREGAVAIADRVWFDGLARYVPPSLPLPAKQRAMQQLAAQALGVRGSRTAADLLERNVTAAQLTRLAAKRKRRRR